MLQAGALALGGSLLAPVVRGQGGASITTTELGSGLFLFQGAGCNVVALRGENGALVIVIRDQGAGFDPNRMKDPLRGENMFAVSGRGVYILRSFMDEVDFRFPGRGTECRLVKYLPRK